GCGGLWRRIPPGRWPSTDTRKGRSLIDTLAVPSVWDGSKMVHLPSCRRSNGCCTRQACGSEGLGFASMTMPSGQLSWPSNSRRGSCCPPMRGGLRSPHTCESSSLLPPFVQHPLLEVSLVPRANGGEPGLAGGVVGGLILQLPPVLLEREELFHHLG